MNMGHMTLIGKRPAIECSIFAEIVCMVWLVPVVWPPYILRPYDHNDDSIKGLGKVYSFMTDKNAI